MLICEHNIHLQPTIVDPSKNFDWTEAACMYMYSNLDEMPSFISSHRGSSTFTTNLWVEAGLVNGAIGNVVSIYYQSGGPPDLPLAVMVKFDNYLGPTFLDNTVSISNTSHMECWQFTLLTFTIAIKTMTIHKA